MKIFLMRHGEASFQAATDNNRELTDAGREKIRSNILTKRAELSSASCILSSPILRARQTAELARALLQRTDDIGFVDWLVHESSPRDAITALAGYNVDSVILFSHQPFASRFVEILCGLAPGYIAMDTASLVAMESDPVAVGLGAVHWQLA